jgi:glutathione-regulated potassium-efflux system ancillary protein KefG
MKAILNLFHPNLKKSFANQIIVNTIREATGITFVDHYAEYPDFKINVEKEKERLTQHDLIVFEFPFYWYSSPPLLKMWLDQVVEYGFAYPPNVGKSLHGKEFMAIITTGGSEDSYRSGGYNNFTISEFLRPLQQTIVLCGMKWLAPFALHNAVQGKIDERAVKEFGINIGNFIKGHKLNEQHTLRPMNSPYCSD